MNLEEFGTNISHHLNAFIKSILDQFNMLNAKDVSTGLDSTMMVGMAEDRGEKQLKDIIGYQAIVG